MKKIPSAQPAAPNAMKTLRHVPSSPSAHATISPEAMSPT